MKAFNYKTLALTAVLATTAYAPQAYAQTVTEPVVASFTVNNVLTVNEDAQMNFGDAVVITDGTNNATLALATDDSLTPGTAGGTSAITPLGGVAPTAAQLTVTTGTGATITAEIDNVANLDDDTTGLLVMPLTAFFTSEDGAAAVSRTIGTGFTYVSGGTDVFEVGATITATGTVTYANDLYNGGFDFIVSY